jgi:hypothetical protein
MITAERHVPNAWIRGPKRRHTGTRPPTEELHSERALTRHARIELDTARGAPEELQGTKQSKK